MHEDLGSHAGRAPDPAERGYRVDVLLDGATETAVLALAGRIADLVVEAGFGTPEDGEIRAMIEVRTHPWSPDLAEAPHVLVPRAIPRSPDFGANYSPN